ncbi:type 1 glutamine amidotransferase [Nocardioides sp.]|uniref:type 1 glutamine amidotransferase n=1 Tax=Nocardioides sp. TaxID=35761 RepID=UPI00356A67E4
MTGAVSSPRVLVVEHAGECPPALLGTWLVEAGCALEVSRPWAGEELRALASYDALVVLGGPMGADDDALYPWLTTVKERVREAAAAELPTLGICLGHQLAAVALGGEVRRNPRGQQMGVLEVGWQEDAAEDGLLGGMVDARRGVQWNNDVVTALPEGTTVLARTPEGELQVARFAPTVWGVQLHPEADRPVVEAWADSDRGSHEALGIDQEALLVGIDGARAELDEAWRPLATRLAALATGFAERRR